MSNRREEFRKLLQTVGESLDITETQYEAATKHYEAVSDWLKAQDSPLAAWSPHMYPQGSFRLGTVTKPVNEDDEYDFDFVCELKALRENNVTQSQLKKELGARLSANETYRRMLDKERNRCWRLHYADSLRFHMDILPAIPNHRLSPGPTVAGAILIPDKELHAWQLSNPIGYAEWFKERMKVRRQAALVRLAESLRVRVDEVPDYKIKTPLQRAIQILKRHRDMMFKNDQEDRPISIIITTLAAHAYNNEEDLLDALEKIAAGMPRFIEQRNGVAWVPNPVNPEENFADKWQANPERGVKFGRWLSQVRTDIEGAVRADVDAMLDGLAPKFGDKIIREAAERVYPRSTSRAKAAVAAVVGPVREVRITNPSKPWGT
jgi:hypothetical protein